MAASPSEVYELVANAARRAEWLPELDAVSAPDRALVRGDRFDGFSSLLLHRFVGSSEVVDAVPAEALEERVIIGARLTTRWELTGDGNGRTTVTHLLDVDFPEGPLGRLERWVLGRRLARLQRNGLRRLQAEVGAHDIVPRQRR